MSNGIDDYIATKFAATLDKCIADREVWSTMPHRHTDYSVQLAEARFLAAKYAPEIDPSLGAAPRWQLDCKAQAVPKLYVSPAMNDLLGARA